jgi:G-patch domain
VQTLPAAYGKTATKRHIQSVSLRTHVSHSLYRRVAMKLPPGHVPGVRQQRPSGFGGVGEALLRRMGWEKGQGLGKDKHGMKEALDVKKKEDTLGVRD